VTSPETRCRFEQDIPAWFQNELSAEEKAEFEQHLAGCPSCEAASEEYRRLIRDLQAPMPEIPSRDLAPAVLARIRAERSRRWPAFAPVVLRAAAILLALVLAGVLVGRLRPAIAPRDRFVAAALGWLHETQEPEGRWDAAKWGAQQNYTPALTALAALAFLRQDASALRGPHAEVVRRGLDFLLTQQNAEGRFGILCSGTPYNQGMATLALIEAAGCGGEPRWREAADKALEYIRATQLAHGGWGYPRTSGDPGNTSITVWQLQCLLKAEALGRGELRPAIEKGMAWLNGVVDEQGRVGYSRARDFPNGYETLTAAGALCLLTDPQRSASAERLAAVLRALEETAGRTADVDYYRLYFTAHALRVSGTEKADALVTGLQQTLFACQSQGGKNAGSCETPDRWTSAGGRVYATAMAVLAM